MGLAAVWGLMVNPTAMAELSRDLEPEIESAEHGAALMLSGSDLAQALSTITAVEIRPAGDGAEIVVVADGRLAPEPGRVEGNAFILDIPNVALALADAAMAEQFSPAAGIALVQVSHVGENRVRIAITGRDGPPTVQPRSINSGLALTIIPGEAATAAPSDDAIQVVVTATRTETELQDVPRSVTVITRQALEQQQLLTDNLPDILGTLVPGLGPPTRQNRIRNLSLRGRRPLILIDGVPQNANSSFETELNVIDPSSIERIEVVRGPSALYGDGAAGGIINIITRSPSGEDSYNLGVGTRASLSNLQGDSLAYNVQLGADGARDNASIRLDFAYGATNSQYDANGDRIPAETGVIDTDSIGLTAKLRVDFTEEQQLNLGYSFYREALDTRFISDSAILGIPGLQTARALELGPIDYDEPPRQTNHVVNLTYQHDNVLGSQLNAQAYYHDLELSQTFADIRPLNLPDFFPQLFQTNLDFAQWGTRLQLDTPLGNSASLLWGVDYSQERNQRPLLVSDPTAFDQRLALNVVEVLDQTPLYHLNSLGLFGQLRWDITDQWQISGGIRYDNFNFSVDDFAIAFAPPPNGREGGNGSADDISFNAGIIYQPIPEVSLFASFAQGFSIPDLGLAFSQVGPEFNIGTDLFLQPQTVNSFEVGARAEFDQVQLSLAGFYSQSELGSALRVGPDGFTELVRAPQRNYGIEATVDWQPSQTWRLGGIFGWNEGENDANNDGEFLALSSVQVQPYKIGAYVENDTTPTWTNRLQLLAVGGRNRAFNDTVDGFTVDGYITLDLVSSLQLGAGQLTLGIENLLNNQYLPVSSQERIGATEGRRFAAPGATVSLRYQIEF
ncbi:MAG: TonB-dependent receptor domain-containing protein [Nodosilinea sp.]